MAWEFKNGIPIYTQIVDEMVMRIVSGKYAPGERLPSVRDLALEAGVNPNTMQRGLGELERRKLIYTERTSGKFITEDEEVLKELNNKMAEKYVSRLIEELSSMGLDRDQIIQAVMAGLEEESARSGESESSGRGEKERKEA